MTTIAPAQNQNPGIVPPWLTSPAKPPVKNPGIVPPWLQQPIRILPIEEPITILPVEAPEFSILPIDGETTFVSTPAAVSPTSLADALRGR